MTSPGPAPLPGPHPVPGTPDPAPENGVSFVVPVYNKARVLPPVLDAMAAQQGDFPREFIFVDDGSTDDSRWRGGGEAAGLRAPPSNG